MDHDSTDVSMTAELDTVLAAIVRGEAVGAPGLAAFTPTAVCDRAAYHGVLPLLAERLADATTLDAELRDLLRRHARSAIAADLVRGRELTAALAAFAAAGVDVLLLKGEQLAYRWYARPDLRPRLDTDLLIPRTARAAASEVLTDLGYELPVHVTGELLNYQGTFIKWRDGLKLHVFDVHWRIANPQVFAGLLTYEELAARADRIPALGPHARGIAPAAALLLACVHRVAHHFDSDRLIWLYDIHLIATQLTDVEWQEFVALAADRQVAAICWRGLELARRAFGTAIPDVVSTDVRLRAPAGREATAVFMAPGRRPFQNVANDLRALPTWGERLRLLWQHVFPSPRYMREVYALSSRAPLPLLYATRVVRGARRWLGRLPVYDASRLR
jgi:hypothetical protein